MIPLKKILSGTEKSLHLVDDQFLFVWKTAGGESRYKFVSPAAVRAAVAREPLDSGWIPASVQRCGSGARGDWSLAWFGPRSYKVTILDRKLKPREISVPLPGFVFAGSGRDYVVFATKGKAFATDAALFHAPLPNVEAYGRICFGSNRVPHASASRLEAAFEVFMTTPFNGHSSENKTRSHAKDVRDLLFELARAKAPRFPERDLVPAGTSIERVVSEISGARSGR